jgi:hypothetical protein
MVRLERFNERTSRWDSIDKHETPILSWHEGGTDQDGWKVVGSLPEEINIATMPTKASLVEKQNIVFTYLSQRPHKVGRFRMCIDVTYKLGKVEKIERWLGCLDLIGANSRRLTIMECEDINEWK